MQVILFIIKIRIGIGGMIGGASILLNEVSTFYVKCVLHRENSQPAWFDYKIKDKYLNNKLQCVKK